MGVKLKDFLARKGLRIEAWMDANNVISVEDLRIRAGLLAITLLPEDEETVQKVLLKRKKAFRASKKKEKPVVKPASKPAPNPETVQSATNVIVGDDDAPKPRRRRRKVQTTEE